MDESRFGGRRKGRRGRGVEEKVVAFGILKRNGRVYAVVVDNAKPDTLMPKQKIMPDSIVYTDSLHSYDKPNISGFQIVESKIKHDDADLKFKRGNQELDVSIEDKGHRIEYKADLDLDNH